ncbi:MAG: thioredoxin family protein [Bacteroidota bacterium]
MNRRMSMLLVLVLPLLIGAGTSSTRVKFINGNLNFAKEKAAQEGKLYFIDFYASWCMPCRWMDETTFSDRQLTTYVSENYIPVKIDIDDFDGYAYKQLYNIKMLPSILIFNSQGKLLAQYEESMAPSKLLKILQQHNIPQNKLATQGGNNTVSTKPPSPAPKMQKPSAAAVKPPPAYQKPSSAAPQTPPQSNTQSPPNKQQETNIRTNTNPAPPEFGQGLYRFKVSRKSTKGYSVQIGAFREYGNVLREAAKLEAAFKQPIIVQIGLYKGQPVYKVMVGEFNGRKQADQLKTEMARKGVPGIVKDLSTVG